MVHLKTITDSDLFPSAAPAVRDGYTCQESARAVVFDEENNVGLLNTGVYKIHKLPGGTINPGESATEACLRECKEELGCTVKITSALGYIDEFKDKRREHRRSYCYLAQVVGEKGLPAFTRDEKESAFEIVWTPLPHAIKLVEQDKPIDYDGHFIRQRELEFIKQLIVK